MKIRFRLPFFIVLFWFLLPLIKVHSQAITINLAGPEEVQSAIENFTDQILIQTINNTSEPRNVYFRVVITGNTSLGMVQIDNYISAPTNEILIPVGGTSFSLTTLIEEYQNSSLDDYTIIPPALEDQLRRDRQLPAGEYRICLEARSVENGSLLSLPGENNCINVRVIYRDPPIIESPQHNTWVGESDFDEIQFIWSMSTQQPEDQFTVEVVRFSDMQQANDFMEQGRPQHMFNTFERIFIEEGVTTWTFNTFQADILPELNTGDILAVRVTATSGNSVFLNNGHSQIHVFIYGIQNAVLCQNPSLYSEFVYPSPGDTLPFSKIFHVARFQPSCDNILEFDGAMTFYRSGGGGVAQTVGPIAYSDNWRSGPGPARYLRQYFSRHFPGQTDYYYPAGSDYETYLPFLNDNDDTRFTATRGDRIYANGRVNFTVKDLTNNQEYQHSINLSGLAGNPTVIGMPKPRLDYPENDAILRPGPVEFTFSTGNEPGNPLPPFKVFKIRGNEPPVVPSLQVSEKCVLQVANANTFLPQEIVFCRLKKIQNNPYNNGDSFQEDNPVFEPFSPTFDLTPNRLFDQDHFVQSVYKDIGIQHDFTVEDTLYWRVVWLKDPTAFNVLSPCSAGIIITQNDIYHESEVRRLILSNEAVIPGYEDETQDCALMYTDEDLPGDESATSECASHCRFPALTSMTPSGSVNGRTSFTAAGFTVEVEDASPGTSSNGNGFVIIPFLNNLKLRVSFSGIQLNADGQMIAGTITPETDESFPLTRHVSTLGNLFSMGETEADALEASLEAGGKLLSLLGNGSEISLPVGIDKMVGSTRIVIGITTMTFKKDTAHLNMVVNIRIPTLQELNGFISLGAQVCITNEGFGNDVRLYLPQDQVFPMGGTNEFRVKGAEGAIDRNSITSVEWDCNGFRALNLVGAVRFTRDWLLPEDERGTIRPTGQVEARFGGRFTQGGNILIRLDMDNFQVPGAEGWGFTPAHNIWIDLSDTENPTNLRAAIPEGYTHPAFTDSGMGNTWKGFFMEELSVKTPEYLQGPDRNRLTFALRNMFIDHTGISFKASAENILRWDGAGDMNGWAASLDTVFFHMVQNNFRSFGFNGKLGLPIAERTQYMKYQAALVHDEGNFNLVMSVRPADNINIPISMAMAVIERGSYVEVSLGHENYIEANLCASLRIGNENLSEGQTMPSTLSMPGIRIQNLKINSETGLDTSDFAFSLTGMDGLGLPGGTGGGGDHFKGDENSPLWYSVTEGTGESTLSGFPIGLDHFSFSNDKITIQPRLTLTGGEGGFSAAAKISLLINMDLASSPQRFDVTGVQLDRIDLAIETSEITLAGYLEFYKTSIDEGVKGGITMEINLGTRVGVNINADFGCRKMPGATTFNREDWFSYFYVDGMAYLSSGITLFSGVSLFGLGGGFYHHMVPTNALPTGSSVAGGAGSGTNAPSGVLYRPDFSNDLGLKFMVILGSNDQGQAYNLDVKLEATFSFHHGLTMLRFEGSFRVMTDGISVRTIGREGNSPVAGYVGMTLNMPPLAPASFNGQFFVKLNAMPDFPILRGLGRLDSVPTGWTSQNAMVWATFYAGPEEWFFYMGTPTNRCGVSLQLGGQELLRVTNYMMIGHGIPVIMPEPDEEFVRIFENGMDPEAEFEGSDGDVNNLLEGRPRPNVPLGTGFAFGMSMVMNTGDISIFPFYFALKAVMGCDINVTQAPESAERRCSGSDRVPGMDGWYATGQFYAGIEGSFGILIPLFVTEIRATILEASAAMILQGGLPNPEWVSGRGSFYYNVCDGLAEGRCSFELTAGTVCIPTTGNPFAGIKMIQDLSPANGETDVSVYTKVSAAFSMEMNRTYEIEENTGPTNPPVIRRLQPYMQAFELRRQGATGLLPFSTREWTENNHVYTAHPVNRLDAQTQYNLRVVARVRENGRDMVSAGRVFQEELTHTFTTGDEPDKIVDENLSFTYPYISQQTFFKGETRENKGYIRCIQGNNSCLKPLGDVTNIERRWYARFTSDNGHSFTSPVTIIPGFWGVVFDVASCQNNTMYCVQVIREDRPRSQASDNMLSDRALGMAHGATSQPGTDLLNNRLRQFQITNFSANVGASSILSNQFKRIQLPSDQVGRYETQLYHYFFKTSRYQTMEEKLAAEQTGWQNEEISFGVDLVTVKKNMTETFEWVDNQTFTVLPSSGKVFTKRLVFRAEPPPQTLDGGTTSGRLRPNQYLIEIIQNRVIAQHVQALLHRESMRRRVTGANPGMNIGIPAINPADGFDGYHRWMYIKELSSLYGPLSQTTIRNAFNRNALQLPGGSIGLGSQFRIPSGGGFTMSDRSSVFNTHIAYELTVEGLRHYRQMRSTLLQFQAGNVTISSPSGSSTVPVDNLLNETERTFLRRHILRTSMLDQSRYINFTKGPQTMGMMYLFPDQNGRDVQGSLFPFTFRL
jgi:hypothetical protein